MATDTTDAIVQTGHVEAGPQLLGLDAEGWVYVSLTIFILLAIFVGKAHRTVTAKLDEKIADTRRSLDEARALREEAEAMLAEAKRKQADAHATAQAILAGAQTEASQLVEKARADVATLIDRRGKMAEDKIAAAERVALAEVRAKAATAAAAAAAAIIAEKHDRVSDAALIDRTIASLS